MSLDSRVAGLPYESSSFATSRGNESVTELAFYVIWYDKHSGDWLAALAPLSGFAGLLPQFGRSIERKALLWAG